MLRYLHFLLIQLSLKPSFTIYLELLMKPYILIVLAILCCSVSSHSPQDAIIGNWYSFSKKDVKVNIYKKSNGKYYGKITWASHPKYKEGETIYDRHNPNTALQSRPVVGIDIFTDWVYDAKENEWTGKVYEPRAGRSADCYTILKDSKTLIVTGYKYSRYLSESETFIKLD